MLCGGWIDDGLQHRASGWCVCGEVAFDGFGSIGSRRERGVVLHWIFLVVAALLSVSPPVEMSLCGFASTTLVD